MKKISYVLAAVATIAIAAPAVAQAKHMREGMHHGMRHHRMMPMHPRMHHRMMPMGHHHHMMKRM
jgi:hypothetical protein